MSLPLDGILIADFSRVLAGPYATATLGDLGATVVKVERPGAGDDTRSWGPPWTANGAAYFESANRNKSSLTLDLGNPDDVELAKELARRADVLVENFRPGVLARFGLDHDTLAASNPGLVYCSITGFGSGGGAHLPGYDFLVQAVGGLMSITGEADAAGGVPTKAGVALVDVLTAKDATVGILAALHARTATGRGQRVEVNLLSSLLAALVNQASSYLATGTPPGRLGNAHPSIAPYELLPCADGAIAIACGNDNQFGKLAAVVGNPDLAGDARYRTNAERVRHRAELAADLGELLAADTVDAWAERLLAAGVPAGKVGTIADGFALATELGLDPLVEVGEGRPAQVRNPITFSDTVINQYSAPPALGEQDETLRHWLQQEESR